MKLPQLSADKLAQLISATSDIALVLNSDGVIESVSVGWDELSVLQCPQWIGKTWVDTVTSESRPKVSEMLATPTTDQRARWQHNRSCCCLTKCWQG